MKLSDQDWKKYLEFATKRAKTYGAKGEMIHDMAASAIEKLVKQKSKPENIEAWISKVIRNQLIDLGRKRVGGVKSRHDLTKNVTEMVKKAIAKKGKRKDADMDKSIMDLVGHISVLIEKSPGSRIASVIDNKAKVKKLMDKLSVKDKKLIFAHFFEDKSNKSIAKEMGYATDKVVATRIKQILKKLGAENIN